MIDLDLERRYADCSELVEAWRVMFDMINRATKSPELINPQEEEMFLRSKARIAMLHDSFMDSLTHDKPVGTNMIEIVNRAITLRNMTKMSDAEAKKLELEWHEVYLLLNETVSTLNEKRAELAEINETMWKIKKMVERAKTNFKAFLKSIYFKLIVAFAVLMFIIYGVPAIGIYDWDKLRDIRPLEPGISATFWAGRMVGMHTPYFSLREFTDAAFKNPVGGLTHTSYANERNKTDAARTVSDVMLARVRDMQVRTDFREILEGADQYDALKIVTDGGRDEAYMYLFWFRRVPQASRANAFLRPHSIDMNTDFQVIQKTNILIILYSRNQDLLQRIKENRVDIMRP